MLSYTMKANFLATIVLCRDLELKVCGLRLGPRGLGPRGLESCGLGLRLGLRLGGLNYITGLICYV